MSEFTLPAIESLYVFHEIPTLADASLESRIRDIEQCRSALDERRVALGTDFARAGSMLRPPIDDEMRQVEALIGEADASLRRLHAEHRRRASDRRRAEEERARAASGVASREEQFVSAVQQLAHDVQTQLESIAALSQECRSSGIDPIPLLTHADVPTFVSTMVRRRLAGRPQLIERDAGFTYLPNA
jgi:hypothetical protein